MVRDKEFKKDLMLGLYNRRAFNDTPNLPKWFVDDEERANKSPIQPTKEVMQEVLRNNMAINARTIGKVAEAKARKKMRALRMLAKIRNQATNIAESNDLTPGQKTRQIEKLYQKLKKGQKKDRKIYVVNSKFGTRFKKGESGKVKFVDARSKKDARANKRLEAKKSGKGKKKKGGKSKSGKRKRR